MVKIKEMIELNNEKREQLNEENEKDYEDMLTYIRLASTKSERETEEILLELLDHILIAQEEGKTVRDIFGEDLKTYSQELINEIPEETKKKQLKFASQLILIFLAVSSLFTGILNSALYYIFEIGNENSTYYLGSSIVIVILNVFIALGAIYYILEWLKKSIFLVKRKSKKMEFFQLWLIMTFIIGLFFCVIYFMPEFGMRFSVPVLAFIPLGVILYACSRLLKD